MFYLRNNGEVDVEVEIKRLDRDICPQATIFPFMPKGVRRKCAVTLLGHQNDRVENPGDSSGRKDGAPDDAIRGSKVVCKDRWRMGV